MNNIVYIYALCDNKERQEFHIYIGKSANPYIRYYQHLQDNSDTYKVHWIKSLLKQKMTPVLQILEQCDIKIWKEREMDWISFYKKCGYKIVNSTEGGEGISNPSKEIRQKISKVHLGKITSIETKKKISQAQIGKKISNEIKRKIIKNLESMAGKKHSEQTKIKMRNNSAWKGKNLPIEIKRKMIINHKGMLGKKHSEETKLKMRLSHKKNIV